MGAQPLTVEAWDLTDQGMTFFLVSLLNNDFNFIIVSVVSSERRNVGALLLAAAKYDLADAASPRTQHDLEWWALAYRVQYNDHNWDRC